jgi:hypothetical protein
MADTSGSIRNVGIDGRSFRAAADVDITFKASPFEKEAVPTSGNSVIKKTIISTDMEGVDITCNSEEHQSLVDIADKNESVELSVTLASGVELKTQGSINVGDYSTADAKCEVKLMPENALSGWERF